jgi:hypothetical protein
MRRVLLTAVAVAPMLALLGGEAFAACPAAGSTVSTDTEVTAGCTITPAAGNAGIVYGGGTLAIDPGATISNVNVNNSTGLLIQGGATGQINFEGSISLTSSFSPPLEGNTGLQGGPFTSGTNRIGIDLEGAGGFNGPLTLASGSSINIQGDNSVGILINAPILNNDLTEGGVITVLGNQTIGLEVTPNGSVGGNLTTSSTISATGTGAQGLVVNGSVGGALTIGASITTTAYRSETAPTNATTLNQLGADQLEQGGSAVVIGSSVGQGVTVSAAITTGSGSSLTTTAAADVSVFGSAPAMQIGAQNKAINIGNTAADPFGLVIGGSITADGVYSKVSTPALPTPASATALVIGGFSGGTVNLNGGIHVVGAVSAESFDAPSTALNIGSGVTAATIQVDGTISATDSGSTPQTAQAITIGAGANVSTIANTGSIFASVTDTKATTGAAAAIIDQSGTVTSITNTGTISAALSPAATNFVIQGPTTAIDVSHATNGTSISQSTSTTFAGQTAPVFTGSISGSTLTVTSVANGGNLAIGETVFGQNVAANTVITAEGTGTGGAGTYTLNTTQTVKSEQLTGTGPLPSIAGDVLFGAGVNTFDIEAGTTNGAIVEQPGQRQLTVNVAANPGTTASVTVTAANAHQVTSLDVGSGGVLIAGVNPTFAIGGSNPTPIFDTTVHPGQAGADGQAIFADGAEIGVRLTGLQTAPVSQYVFVQTSGAPGALQVGNLNQEALTNTPFLYSAVASATSSDLIVTLTRKTAQEIGLNASQTAAFNSVFNALQQNPNIANAFLQQTNKFGFLQLYNQMLPDQGLGIFESLEAATQKISNLTEQTPDSGTRLAGSSAWLQEVNTTLKREDGQTLGDTDRVFGLVGGYEKMGAGGGAFGLTLAYLNIGTQDVAEPVGGNLITDVVEAGAYYRRAWEGLRFSVRGAAGYAWFNEKRLFVTDGVSASSNGNWNGYFGDAHAGAEYEFHVSRFYVRPELSADYLYLNDGAHQETGAGPGFDLNVAQRTDERMTGSAVLTVGAQYGHDIWFRPELFGGYREVFFGNIANTVANFTGQSPFLLTPGDINGGWLIAGFSLKAGSPLSYVALEGEADLRQNEQRYNVYLSARAMF